MYLPTHYLVLLILLGISGHLFLLACADGLASETLPPSMIGNRNVTMRINSTPFLIDNNQTGTLLNLVLMDAESQEAFPQVTIEVSTFKGGKNLFDHIFKSDNGIFLLNMIPQKSDEVSVDEKGGLLSGALGQHSGNYDIKGQVFDSGGLYRFKFNVLTMGAYYNQVSKSYSAAISIPQTYHYEIYDKDYGKQNLVLIAYYDEISNFYYDSGNKFINFTMPFDWSKENIDQVSVVHQEIRIPRSFGDFLVTKYQAYVNNMPLSDNAITIDDYSSDSRTVHIVLSKEELSDIVSKQENPKQEMKFSLQPSAEVKFPVTAFTRNAQYKVSLRWDPPTIITGSNAKFYFKVLDPYMIDKTVASVSYDFSVIQNHQVIFKKSGTTANSQTEENVVEVPIPDSTKPIVIVFENLGSNSFAGVEFTSVVTKPTISYPKFPIQLSSFSPSNDSKIPGKYEVDLTWFPPVITVDQQTEFVFTIKDKDSGIPVSQTAYDFVILQKGSEVFRKSGTAPAGGDYVDYTFISDQDGQTTIRIENINDSGELVEAPIAVTPEFPASLLLIVITGFLFMTVFSKFLRRNPKVGF